MLPNSATHGSLVGLQGRRIGFLSPAVGRYPLRVLYRFYPVDTVYFEVPRMYMFWPKGARAHDLTRLMYPPHEPQGILR